MARQVFYTDRTYLASSALKTAWYDEIEWTLYVEFHNGSRAGYANVPPTIYQTFVGAPSAGRYYNTSILGMFDGVDATDIEFVLRDGEHVEDSAGDFVVEDASVKTNSDVDLGPRVWSGTADAWNWNGTDMRPSSFYQKEGHGDHNHVNLAPVPELEEIGLYNDTDLVAQAPVEYTEGDNDLLIDDEVAEAAEEYFENNVTYIGADSIDSDRTLDFGNIEYDEEDLSEFRYVVEFDSQVFVESDVELNTDEVLQKVLETTGGAKVLSITRVFN